MCWLVFGRLISDDLLPFAANLAIKTGQNCPPSSLYVLKFVLISIYCSYHWRKITCTMKNHEFLKAGQIEGTLNIPFADCAFLL